MFPKLLLLLIKTLKDLGMLKALFKGCALSKGCHVFQQCLQNLKVFSMLYPDLEGCFALFLFYVVESLDQLYAFTYHPSELPAPSGWGCTPPSKLLTRWKCSQDRFRVSSVNKKFALCSSYPEEVIVPSSISDEDIVKVRYEYGGTFLFKPL